MDAALVLLRHKLRVFGGPTIALVQHGHRWRRFAKATASRRLRVGIEL
ncbi:MAG: hypothetical protein JWO83_3244, partial [Caulobacteraceae bacterium]|nr:hypothetical protein [Caulobacteraceae bacterium]